MAKSILQGADYRTRLAERRQAREASWRKHVAAWRSTGISQAAYCRQQHLTPQDFSWWKRELARRDERGAATATFVPLKLAVSDQAAVYGCEVVLANGRCLRVGAGVSARFVAELASALEGPAQC